MCFHRNFSGYSLKANLKAECHSVEQEHLQSSNTEICQTNLLVSKQQPAVTLPPWFGEYLPDNGNAEIQQPYTERHGTEGRVLVLLTLPSCFHSLHPGDSLDLRSCCFLLSYTAPCHSLFLIPLHKNESSLKYLFASPLPQAGWTLSAAQHAA